MLRHPLILEAATIASDDTGGLVETWNEVAAVFGSIEPISAMSITGADQTLESVSHRIAIRFRAGVQAGMRFAKGARRFTILTVHDPDETRRFLLCRAREEKP